MNDRILDPNRLLAKRSVRTRFGYDYGISAHALLAIDIEFLNLLYEAEVVGCAYGLMPFPNSGVPMRLLSLVVQNEKPAKRAFEVFKLWSDSVDADSVKVEIVILSTGGYLLLVGPEPMRSSVRLTGYGSLYSPISVGSTYVKKMDTASEGLFDLQEYKRSPISPVMFSAAATDAREPTQKMNLRQIVGCPELIKYELTVMEEAEARRDPFMNMFIDGAHKTNDQSVGRSTPRNIHTPEKLLETRARMIKQCFPVTLHRIRTTPSIAAIKRAFISKGLREWQIDQAICNAQIFELCHKHALANVDRDDEDAILSVVSKRFEEVLQPFLPLNEYLLEEQLLADAQYLVTKLDPHLEPASTLFESAAQLAHLGVLNE